jgi:deoxycytidylate deaminase/dephospho-CoA kinase
MDLVVGVTGPLGAGRSTTAQYLQEKGFEVCCLSDILRAEAAAGGNESPTIDELQDLGDKLREQHGPQVLAKEAFRSKKSDRLVLDGIKNPGEIEWLEKNAHLFHLVAVDASRDAREKRKVGRGQDQLSQRQFHDAETRDLAEADAFGVLIELGQQVEKCVRRADFVTWNDDLLLAGKGGTSGQDGHLDSLHSKIERFLDTVERPDRYHPTGAELLMAQATIASMGSQCIQRKVGAVVASTTGDILTVGSNNAPAPLKSCRAQHNKCYRQIIRDRQFGDAAAHFRCHGCKGELNSQLVCKACSTDHSDAFRQIRNLDFCRALHAEEAALLNLARAGAKGQGDLHLYSTTFPCGLCAQKIVHAGIDTVIFVDPYPGTEAFDAFKGSGVRVEHFEGFTLKGMTKVWGEAR